MPNQKKQTLPSQPAPEGKWVQLEISLGPSREMPILYANKVLVTFTGNEFLLYVVSAFPEPQIPGSKSPLPKSMEGKVLAKFAFSVREWIAATRSFNEHVNRLMSEGAFVLEETSKGEQ